MPVIAMDTVELDESSSPDHDQLPAVAEVLGSGRNSHLDSDGSQLPDVEEYKTQAEAVRPRSKISQRRSRRRILLLTALIIVAVISIVIGVIVGRDTAPVASTTSETGGGGNPYSDSVPAPAPTREFNTRREDIANLVSKMGWTDSSVANQENTAQYEAILWLADEDPARLEVVDTDEFRERYALTVFHYALSGYLHRWVYIDIPWLTGEPVCLWNTQYQTKQGEKVEMGVRCHGGSAVKEIYLPDVGAEGEIPDEIALLHDLEGLFLNGNDLRGALNPKIQNLENLKDLDVRGNYLQGTFPYFLGMMPLRTLDISHNYFQGKFPESLNGFSSLTTFAIGYNNFTDDIKRLAVLSNAKEIDISNCSLVGTFDSDLLSNWPNVEILDMSDNMITGSLPGNLFEADRLDILDLHGNYFNGSLPLRVKAESDLSFLALHDNELTGNINIITQSLTKLHHLDLSSNSFTGAIPSLASMSNLRYLFLAFNTDFQRGPIPPSITSLPNLVDLSLQSTLRTGAIPTAFGSQKNLLLLDLGFNELGGRIPSELGLAESLQFLFLNRNQLTGGLPENFKYLTQLRVLLLDRNNLVGPTNAICDNKPAFLEFIADCEEIKCPIGCCTKCCDDGDQFTTCKDEIWNGQLDPVHEYEYKRSSAYKFSSSDIIYPAVSPTLAEEPVLNPPTNPPVRTLPPEDDKAGDDFFDDFGGGG